MRQRRILFQIMLILLAGFGISCSQPFSDPYYYQQQARDDGGSNEDPSDGDWGDDTEMPDDEETPGSLSSFDVILPGGELNETLLADDPSALEEIRRRLPEETFFTPQEFQAMLIRSRFTGDNVPVLWYEENGTWSTGNQEKHEFVNGGPDTDAGGNGISSVNYYAYRSYNPFFPADNSYNLASFGSEGERRMERFIFYRFTGETALPSLDNMLVAVDSYTGLFFCFGKPVEYKSYFGQEVPIKWAPVDVVSQDADGKQHRFYEYDPAGYVNSEGKFVAESWYKDHLARGDYDPVYTGKSPYSIKLGEEIVLTPEIQASSLEDGLLEKDGRFYTAIKIAAQPYDLIYEIFRRDDRSDQWQKIGEPIEVKANEEGFYEDYDALIIESMPSYKVTAYDSNFEELGESEAVEGGRALSDREMLVVAMDTIRRSFSDLWYTTGSAWGSLKADKRNGDSGVFYHGVDRDGFFGTNYRRYQRYENYRRGAVELTGSFMKDDGGGAFTNDLDGLWTQHGSNWPGDGRFQPQSDWIEVTANGRSIRFSFQDIRVSFPSLGGQDGNEPSWSSGSLQVESERGSRSYGKDDIPFALFMDWGTFINALVGDGYTQKP